MKRDRDGYGVKIGQDVVVVRDHACRKGGYLGSQTPPPVTIGSTPEVTHL